MSLADLIHPKRKSQIATATTATDATGGAGIVLPVASVATVAVAKSETGEVANVPATIAADCAGALHDPDGGLYLPWGPYMSADDVRQLRAELAELIGGMADAEGWTASCRDEVLVRAVRGSLSDLLPNLAHFRERAAQFYAESEAHRLSRSRVWRANEDLPKRGY
jgi:hypothetical protein